MNSSSSIHNKKGGSNDQNIRRFLDKIVINTGIGRASTQSNFEEKISPQIIRDLALITGQKPHPRPAKKSIAGFKLREGQIIGLRITLRQKKMVDFFKRLVTIILPRVRDFSGIDEKAIDDGGALNIGFGEQFVFPEINPEESPFSFSLGINMVPRDRNRELAIENYKRLGFPLKSSYSRKENKK